MEMRERLTEMREMDLQVQSEHSYYIRFVFNNSTENLISTFQSSKISDVELSPAMFTIHKWIASLALLLPFFFYKKQHYAYSCQKIVNPFDHYPR